jgi:membrane-associated phospholipid phosphatase
VAPLALRFTAMRTLRSLLLVVVALATLATNGIAQVQTSGDSVHSAKTLFTWRDGVLAAGFAGLTVAMFPVDRSIQLRLQNPHNQENKFLKNAATGLEYTTQPGSLIIGASLYGVGRLAHWHNVQDLGLHGTEAIVFSGAITSLVKGLAGRARPFAVADTNPDDFRIGRGFRSASFQSFPSGHTTAAFAAASVVTRESQRWWPKGIWIVAPTMYGGATLVGLSRMYHNRHWASDVVLGAAVGTFTGIKVVRYSHGHPDNAIDRVLNHAELMTTPNGQPAVGFALTLR